MIEFGEPPYLECSSLGDKRFSALFARVERRGGRTIERIYQSAKVMADGTTGMLCKGARAINQEEVHALYETLWREYLAEHPELLPILKNASGLSDAFGKKRHACQAATLWKLRNEL